MRRNNNEIASERGAIDPMSEYNKKADYSDKHGREMVITVIDYPRGTFADKEKTYKECQTTTTNNNNKCGSNKANNTSPLSIRRRSASLSRDSLIIKFLPAVAALTRSL